MVRARRPASINRTGQFHEVVSIRAGARFRAAAARSFRFSTGRPRAWWTAFQRSRRVCRSFSAFAEWRELLVDLSFGSSVFDANGAMNGDSNRNALDRPSRWERRESGHNVTARALFCEIWQLEFGPPAASRLSIGTGPLNNDHHDTPMAENEFRTTFTGDGVVAELTTIGGVGHFEVTSDVTKAPAAETMILEVLYSPRHANGLADGRARVICAITIPMRLSGIHAIRRGSCWLPAQLKPNRLRHCHFRLRDKVAVPFASQV